MDAHAPAAQGGEKGFTETSGTRGRGEFRHDEHASSLPVGGKNGLNEKRKAGKWEVARLGCFPVTARPAIRKRGTKTGSSTKSSHSSEEKKRKNK